MKIFPVGLKAIKANEELEKKWKASKPELAKEIKRLKLYQDDLKLDE